MKDLDISNIESKPEIVLVSNQSEFDQLMQHLQSKSILWRSGTKPTEFEPHKHNGEYAATLPFAIKILNGRIVWRSMEQIEIDGLTTIPFPAYAAKHIFPHLQEYTKEEVVAIRSHVYEPIKLDVKPKAPKRDRIRVERKGYNELVAEKERLQAENEQLKTEINRLEEENDELEKDNLKWELAYANQGQRLDDLEDKRDYIERKYAQQSAMQEEIDRLALWNRVFILIISLLSVFGIPLIYSVLSGILIKA